MNLNKIKTMVGFAIRSGKIVFGVDNIESTKKPVFLIMADKTLSDRTIKSLEKISSLKNAKLIIIDERLEDIAMRTNCKVVGIMDKNMSENIIMNAGNGGGKLID